MEVFTFHLAIDSEMTEFESKHGIVSRQPAELFMVFTDMRNFLAFVPEDKKKDVTADFDTISATVQGFNIGVKVDERVPYSRIEFVDCGAPFEFRLVMFFDAADGGKTDFHIKLCADLNLMMKMMLGSKIKEAMNKVVDGLVDVCDGKMPEGFDPSKFNMNG